MDAIRRAARTLALSSVAGTIAVLAAAGPAAAHTGNPAGGVVDGVLHPLTGADHLLAMLAVGVVAALAAPLGKVWIAPAAFLLGMVVGGLLGITGAPLPGTELLIIASVVVLGIAIAGAAVDGDAPWLVAALVVAGIAHGHAHGAEAPTAAHPLTYVAGFLLATASLHAVGLGVGSAIRQRRTMQVGMGAATVAAGVLLLA